MLLLLSERERDRERDRERELVCIHNYEYLELFLSVSSEFSEVAVLGFMIIILWNSRQKGVCVVIMLQPFSTMEGTHFLH